MRPEGIDYAEVLLPLAADRRVMAIEIVDRFDALMRVGVPPKKALIQIHGLKPDCPAVREIDAWDGYGICVLSGPTGTSKSVAAARWLDRRRTDGATLLWLSSARLRRLDWDDARSLYGQALDTDAVVIDDYGAPGMSSKLAEELLVPLMVDRSEYGRPTVVTTNRPKQDFGEARVVDRVLEDGQFVVLQGRTLRDKAPRPEAAQARVDQARRFVALCSRMQNPHLHGLRDCSMDDVEQMRAIVGMDRDELESLASEEHRKRLEAIKAAEELIARTAGAIRCRYVEVG